MPGVSPNSYSGRSVFNGPFAATGTGIAKKWQRIECPQCGAPRNGRCRRWASERTTATPEPDGAGRWVLLKNPHGIRVTTAKVL